MAGGLSSSLGRSAAILAAVAVVGAAGGYVWERSSAPDEVPGFEPAPPDAELLAPPRRAGPSPVDLVTVQRATRGLPAYKGAAPEALATDYLGARAPIAVAWFSTRDTPAQVLAFYRKAILEAGLPVVEKSYSEHSGYVGYVDPKNQEVHIVSAMGRGGETMVFPSVAQMGGFLESDAEVPEVLPHPKEAVGTTVLKFHQEGVYQYSVVATVPGGNPTELVEFYKNGFSAKGWKVEKVASPKPNEVRVEVSQPGAMATALIRSTLVSDAVQIYVTLSSKG